MKFKLKHDMMHDADSHGQRTQVRWHLPQRHSHHRAPSGLLWRLCGTLLCWELWRDGGLGKRNPFWRDNGGLLIPSCRPHFIFTLSPNFVVAEVLKIRKHNVVSIVTSNTFQMLAEYHIRWSIRSTVYLHKKTTQQNFGKRMFEK